MPNATPPCHHHTNPWQSLGRALPLLASIALGSLGCTPNTGAHAPIAAPTTKPAPVATPAQAAAAPSDATPPHCRTPNLHEQQRATQALEHHLRTIGHRSAEVVSLVLIDNGKAVARVRSADPTVPQIWHLDSVMHPNPAAPDRWSPQPGDADDARLAAVAEVITAAAPAGLRLFKLKRGRNKPNRVVVSPSFSNTRGAVQNEYRLPFIIVDPQPAQTATQTAQGLDGQTTTAKRAVRWTLREPLAHTLRRGTLAEQQALARHLNAHDAALRSTSGAAQRDPRGALHPVLRHRCKTERQDEGEVFVLVTNPKAVPSRWQMQAVAITPAQHHERTITAQQKALKAHIANQGIKVELLDREQRSLYYRDSSGTLKIGTYRFTLKHDAPLVAGSWTTDIVAHNSPDESLTLYKVLRHHFGGAQVIRWRSAHKAQRLIVLERCLPAKPGCKPQYATAISLFVRIREGDKRFKEGVIRLTRAASRDPFAMASWTVASASLDRVD